MPPHELLRAALDTAVTNYFNQSFQVLMVEANETAMRRFQKGLDKLVKMEAEVAAVIQNLEETPCP